MSETNCNEYLAEAVIKGDIKALDDALRSGANINAATYAANGGSPIFLAIERDNAPIMKALLERGASLGERDYLGNYPLHEAARRGNCEIIKTLIDAGAPVDARNRDEETPLMVAAHHGRPQAFLVLKGQTALRLGEHTNKYGENLADYVHGGLQRLSRTIEHAKEVMLQQSVSYSAA